MNALGTSGVLLGRLNRTRRVYGWWRAGQPATVTRPTMTEPPPPVADDSSRLRVAIDAGPLYGHRTGVGVATAGLLDALAARADVDLDPYVVSFRSKPDAGPSPAADAGHRRLPRLGSVAVAAVRPLGGRCTGDPRHQLRGAPDAPAIRRVGLRLLVLAPPATTPRPWCDEPASDCAGRSWPVPSCMPAPMTPPTMSVNCSGPSGSRRSTSGCLPHLRRSQRSPSRRPSAPCTATRSCWRSVPRSVARRCHPWSTHSPRSPTTTINCTSCSPAHAGDDSQAVEQAIAALPASVRDRVLRIGAVDDATKHWLLRARRRARLPLARRGVRLPDPRGAAGGDSGRRQRRRRHRRDRRRRCAARRRVAIRTSFATALDRAISDGGLRLGLIEAGHRNVRPIRLDRDRRSIDRRVPASWSPSRRPPRHDRTRRRQRHRPGRRRRRGAVPLRGLVAAIDPDASPRSSTPATTPSCTGWRSRPISTPSSTRWRARSIPNAVGDSAGETWQAMGALARYTRGAPDRRRRAGSTWFRLGDRDLATHLYRTARLRRGRHADAGRGRDRCRVGGRDHVAADDRRALPDDAGARRWRRDDLVPGLLRASATQRRDRVDPLRAGWVRAHSCGACGDRTVGRCRDRAVEPARVDRADPGAGRGSILLLAARRESVVAVSPIVGGHALKGPADRMMTELGVESTVAGVARLYAPVAATLVVDTVDADLASDVEAAGMRCVVTPTVMSTPDSGALTCARVPCRRSVSDRRSARLSQAVCDRGPWRPAEVDSRPNRRERESRQLVRLAPEPSPVPRPLPPVTSAPELADRRLLARCRR